MDHARSFRLFERLFQEAQSASGLRDFRTRALAALLGELGGESASFFEPGATDVSQLAVVGSSAGVMERYLHGRARYERSNRRMFIAMESGAAIDGEVYSARERDRLAIYEEILNPQGTRSLVVSWVVHRGRRLGAAVLKRHGRSARFTQRDADAFARHLPAFALADAALRVDGQPRAPLLAGLSRREQEVAALCCKGMRNAEIALLLGTSRNTVKKQMQHVLEKAGVSNRTELAGAFGARI